MAPSPDELLERRYRRWLLAYPADYRRLRGDELIGTLLDLAGPERARPALLEVVALTRSGVVQRIRAQSLRWRNAWSVERRGRSALALGAAWAAVVTVAVAAAPLTLGYSCVDPQEGGMLVDCEPRVGFLLSYHGLWGYLWLLPPLVLAVLPRFGRAGRAVVPAAIALTVFLFLTANTLGTYYLPSLVLVWLGVGWRQDRAMPALAGAPGIPDLPRGR